MKTIVFATHNADKLRELKEILPSFIILSLKDLGINEPIEENGNTLKENALIKARTAHELSGMAAMADDTGLFTDALSGRPGIHSARYSGGGYEDNVKKLRSETEGVPQERRGEHFACCAALVCEKGEMTAEARTEGEITEKPIGEGGFGYDPIFREKTTGLTYAQMSEEQKNGLSHRNAAFKKLLPYILEFVGEDD